MWGTVLATSLLHCVPKSSHYRKKTFSNAKISSFYSTVQIKYAICVLHAPLKSYRPFTLTD